MTEVKDMLHVHDLIAVVLLLVFIKSQFIVIAKDFGEIFVESLYDGVRFQRRQIGCVTSHQGFWCGGSETYDMMPDVAE